MNVDRPHLAEVLVLLAQVQRALVQVESELNAVNKIRDQIRAPRLKFPELDAAEVAVECTRKAVARHLTQGEAL